MDKEEFRVKLEEINRLVDKKDYEGAMKVVDSIDWRRVKNVRTLCVVGEIYAANKRYEDSREIFLLAYHRAPIGKNILYRLIEISLKMGDIEEAEEYFQEFMEVAADDNTHYILQYKIQSAREEPVEEQIKTLEEYKNQEFTERWSYELARLYYRAGQKDKCLDLCNEMSLWFNEGSYVIKALELKKKISGLTAREQQLYERETAHAHSSASGSENVKTDQDEGNDGVKQSDESDAENMPIGSIEVNNAKDLAGVQSLQERISKGIRDIFGSRKEEAQEDEPEEKVQESIPEEIIRRPDQKKENFKDIPVLEEETEKGNGVVSPKESPRRTRADEPSKEMAEPPVMKEFRIPESMQRFNLLNTNKLPEVRRSHTVSQTPAPAASQGNSEPGEFNLEDTILAAATRQGIEIPEDAPQKKKKRRVKKAVVDALSIDFPDDDVNTADAAGQASANPDAADASEQKKVSAEEKALEAEGRAAMKDAPGEENVTTGKAVPEKKDGIADEFIPEEVEATAEKFIPEEADSTDEEYIPEEAESAAEEYIPEEADIADEEYIPEETDSTDEEYIPEEAKSAAEEYIPEEADSTAEEDVPEEDAAAVEEYVTEENNTAEKDVAGKEDITDEENDESFDDDDDDENGDEDFDDDDEENNDEGFDDDDEENTDEDFDDDDEENNDEDFDDDDEESNDEDFDDDEDGELIEEYSDDDDYVDESDISHRKNSYTAEERQEVPVLEEEEFLSEEDLAMAEAEFLNGPAGRTDMYEDDEPDEYDEYEDEESVEDEREMSDDEKFAELLKQSMKEEDEDEPLNDSQLFVHSKEKERKNSSEALSGQPQVPERKPVKLEQTDIIPREHELDEEEEKLFTYFVRVPGMKEQLIEMLEDVQMAAADRTSRTGNIIVMGGRESGKTRLISSIIPAICRELNLVASKVAYVFAEDINGKDIAHIVEKLSGGFLVIEDANQLDARTVDQLDKAMDGETDGLIVILEDEKIGMRKMIARYQKFARKFTSMVNIPVFTNDELVTFAIRYTMENGYKIDRMGRLALYNKIGENQKEDEPMNIGSVKNLLDNAIARAEGGLLKFNRKKRLDRDGYVVLHEKDFS